MEEEALRRAVDGIDSNIYYGGKKVGIKKVYSDRLLELLLKAARPEKFREKWSTSPNKELVIEIQQF